MAWWIGLSAGASLCGAERRDAMSTMSGLVRSAALVAAVTATLVGATARAGVPEALTEQGRLFDAAGVPLEGTLPVRLAIYADPEGGAPLHAHDETVTFDEGYFSVQLGGAGE